MKTVCLSRISSEDSGDVPSYTEDSDDSLELDIDTSRSGQMNLLEEILDSLNTTTMEQGKLSAAKSLDFFRSIEELDYKPMVRKKYSIFVTPASTLWVQNKSRVMLRSKYKFRNMVKMKM